MNKKDFKSSPYFYMSIFIRIIGIGIPIGMTTTRIDHDQLFSVFCFSMQTIDIPSI